MAQSPARWRRQPRGTASSFAPTGSPAVAFGDRPIGCNVPEAPPYSRVLAMPRGPTRGRRGVLASLSKGRHSRVVMMRRDVLDKRPAHRKIDVSS